MKCYATYAGQAESEVLPLLCRESLLLLRMFLLLSQGSYSKSANTRLLIQDGGVYIQSEEEDAPENPRKFECEDGCATMFTHTFLELFHKGSFLG